ncbi:MAG TPA: phasin [Pseudolabrys sp.]|nr:phasin [Pseudolabrys sp.]
MTDVISETHTNKSNAAGFGVPNVEMPAAFRDMAERGIAQAKEGYAKAKAAAEDTTNVLEATYANASKGAADYGLKVVEIARVNTNNAFDFMGKLLTAKSVSDVVELSSTHAREQFEAATEQFKELSALAQKIASDTAEPIRTGVSSALHKAA